MKRLSSEVKNVDLPDPPEGCLLFAVETGDGWCLEVADSQGSIIAYLAWPAWWSKKVDARHLSKSGFDIVPA